MAWQDLPGRRNRATGHDHADNQHGEPLPQRGRIDGQSQLRALPATQNPGQQIGKAGGHIQISPLSSTFVATATIEIA